MDDPNAEAAALIWEQARQQLAQQSTVRADTLVARLNAFSLFGSQRLRENLAAAGQQSRAAGLLGLDTVAGRVQLGLGVGGLLVSGLAAAASLLAASLTVTAAGNAWDGSPAGQEGGVARAARAVAAVSVAPS